MGAVKHGNDPITGAPCPCIDPRCHYLGTEAWRVTR